jgi:tetratricopeptide (TPR) repeat protein
MKSFHVLLVAVLVGVLTFAGCSSGKQEMITTSSPEALAMFKEGLSLYEKFYYDEALAAFEKATSADSLFALPYLYRAAVAFSLSQEPEARTLIARAVQLGSKASPSEQLLIRMWSHRISFDFRAAAATADSLIERYPSMREPYIVRGELYRRNQNLDAAVKVWERALKKDSTCSRALMWLGYANAELGDVDRGISYMKRYIRLVPDAADPRASTGDILLGAGRYEEALAQYQKALELKSNFWYAYQRTGEIYTLYGRLREGEEQQMLAQQILPQTPRTEAVRLAMSARYNLLRGKYEVAERECKEAMAIDSTNISAGFALVAAQVRQKETAQAEQTLAHLHREFQRRDFAGTPDVSSYFLARSLLDNQIGNAEAALAACDSALQYAPGRKRAEVYQQIAAVQLRAKDYESALDACEEALRVAPNSPGVLLAVLRVYKEMGDAKMTAEIGGRLLEFWKNADPDFFPAQEVRTLLGRRKPA